MSKVIRIILIVLIVVMLGSCYVYQSKVVSKYNDLMLVATAYDVEFEKLEFLQVDNDDISNLDEKIKLSSQQLIKEIEAVNTELKVFNLDDQISENMLLISALQNLESTAPGEYEMLAKKSLDLIEEQKEMKAKKEKEVQSNNSCNFEVEGVIIVNKQHCLSADYISPLAGDAKIWIDKLLTTANSEGLDFKMLSGYRSYEEQIATYNYWKDLNGEVEADKLSARPGFSEHQTGLAYDLGNNSDECSLQACFESTKEGEWLKLNAHRFGFVIRYMKGKESITGYNYEPWHLRYLGVDLATAVYDSGLTLEEYFGLN